MMYYTVGFDAKVGDGHFISVGLPSSYFADDPFGPQQIRELVEYAVQYTDVSYLETTLMTMQRGEYSPIFIIGSKPLPV